VVAWQSFAVQKHLVLQRFFHPVRPPFVPGMMTIVLFPLPQKRKGGPFFSSSPPPPLSSWWTGQLFEGPLFFPPHAGHLFPAILALFFLVRETGVSLPMTSMTSHQSPGVPSWPQKVLFFFSPRNDVPFFFRSEFIFFWFSDPFLSPISFPSRGPDFVFAERFQAFPPYWCVTSSPATPPNPFT